MTYSYYTKYLTRVSSICKALFLLVGMLYYISYFSFKSKLADMEMRIQSARLLNYKAALLKDAGKPFTKVSQR